MPSRVRAVLVTTAPSVNGLLVNERELAHFLTYCIENTENYRECTGIAVGTSTVVRYTVDVRYWEYPLSEVPL